MIDGVPTVKRCVADTGKGERCHRRGWTVVKSTQPPDETGSRLVKWYWVCEDHCGVSTILHVDAVPMNESRVEK